MRFLALCLLNFTTERSKDYLYVGTRQGCIDIYDTKQWSSLHLLSSSTFKFIADI